MRGDAKIKLMWGIALLLLMACLSFFIARQSVYSDFTILYSAAHAVLDGKSVYDLNLAETYPVPEPLEKKNLFIYSMPSAYLLSPLAFLDYYTAKAAMIFLNIVLYIAGVAIILRNKVSGRWFTYPLLFSLMWFPFIQGIRSGQVNAIIFFLLVIAVYYAEKEHYGAAGFFLAFASLFKLFPIGIAFALGLKHWRITAYCILFFCASLLIPGSLQWFAAIGNIYVTDFMPTYFFFKEGNLISLLYGLAIMAYTGFIIIQYRDADTFLLVAFAIPAIFLLMPIVEYHHLTLLIFSYAVMLNNSDRKDLIIMLATFLLLNASLMISRQSYLFNLPLLTKIIWLSMIFTVWFLVARKITAVKTINCFTGKSKENLLTAE